MYNLFIDKEIQYSGYKIPHMLLTKVLCWFIGRYKQY